MSHSHLTHVTRHTLTPHTCHQAHTHTSHMSPGTHLPFGVDVGQQMTSMSSRQHHKASVATVNVFHGGPGADNAVSRPEGKIVQVWRERVHG